MPVEEASMKINQAKARDAARFTFRPTPYKPISRYALTPAGEALLRELDKKQHGRNQDR
jgi:hypothetical protein